MQVDDIYYDPQDIFFDTPMCFDCSPGDWLGEEMMLDDVKKLIEQEDEE
jgi:hypothetical protein